MQHTAERICKLQRENILNYLREKDLDCIDLVLLSSWGMDGSTGHSQYHQRLPEGKSDADLFATATTPIRLSLHADDKQIFWLNLAPQSVRFCRPICLEFVKESKEVVKRTIDEIEREIDSLEFHRVNLTEDGEKFVLIGYTFIMTMIDGKVFCLATDNSSMQCCPVCGATPNIMSDKERLEEGFTAKEECLSFGIQPLHSWMRILESLLHIAYRRTLKTWRVTADLRGEYTKTKLEIQHELRENFQVNVDQPKLKLHLM